MFMKAIILACVLATVLAYPDVNHPKPVPTQRVRREAPTQYPLQLQGGGGGSRKQGFDVKIDGSAPVWKSDNGRHQIDLGAGYTQHLGGQYGSGKPDYRVRGGYTYTFGR